jgi:hypothetical protein
MNATLSLIAQLLQGAGYSVQAVDEREGLLGEDAARVVWVAHFPGVVDLLERWENEQAWLVGLAEQLSLEKSWELYLVLACGPRPDRAEQRQLDAVRRDTAYARKVIVPGADALLPTTLRSYLAPLEQLDILPSLPSHDALEEVERKATAEGRRDALEVLAAFRENRPLFDSL